MEKSMETKEKTKKIVSSKSTTQRDDITTRVSKEIVQKAHEKNLTPKQFINKLLIACQIGDDLIDNLLVVDNQGANLIDKSLVVGQISNDQSNKWRIDHHNFSNSICELWIIHSIFNQPRNTGLSDRNTLISDD